MILIVQIILFMAASVVGDYHTLMQCDDAETDLTNKTVILTGGAQGIGFAIADKFLDNGVGLIIILDIDEEKGTEAAKTLNCAYGKGKVVYIKCDVTKDLDAVFKNITETYEYIDILVNDAGILDEYDPRKMITTNSIALIEWSLKLREYMRKDKDGRGGTIINLSSVFGYMIHPFVTSYTASKYAVLGFSKSLGHEYNYQYTCVRVVAICPGFTYTAMTAQQMVVDEQVEDFEKIRRSSPWQTADDVGRGIVQVFQTAHTGTAWDIIGGNPPSEAPASSTLSLAYIESL